MNYSIDMLKVGDADAFVIWAKEGIKNYIIFLDGGRTEDGSDVIKHYEEYIAPFVGTNRHIYIINSHPHNDHINGLFAIVEHFKNDISVAVYNNPLLYVSEEQFENIRRE